MDFIVLLREDVRDTLQGDGGASNIPSKPEDWSECSLTLLNERRLKRGVFFAKSTSQ